MLTEIRRLRCLAHERKSDPTRFRRFGLVSKNRDTRIELIEYHFLWRQVAVER
jgi:hypothetical protein